MKIDVAQRATQANEQRRSLLRESNLLKSLLRFFLFMKTKTKSFEKSLRNIFFHASTNNKQNTLSIARRSCYRPGDVSAVSRVMGMGPENRSLLPRWYPFYDTDINQ